MVSQFETRKVFHANNMPSDVGMEVCDEVGNSTAIRIFLTGYDSHPLTREWLLMNGAEESDEFVLVWVEW